LKRVLRSLPVILFFFLALNNFTLAADSPPVKGGKLPAINLPTPKDQNEKRYLGLSGDGYFKIPQIKAQVVIITIFSLYCTICQSTASAIVELYHSIENDPDLKDKMKLIGIGAGNSPYEVEVFKETYNIPFPTFPDKDFNVHKALGDVRTPYFIVLKINPDGSDEVIHTQLGGVTEAGLFLKLILEAYGIKQKDSSPKREDLAISLSD
jgi:peroxiredoxin